MGLWKKFQRHRLGKRGLPQQWLDFLQARTTTEANIIDLSNRQLTTLINIFMTEKRFIPVKGVNVNLEDRLTIALQACLMIMNLDQGCYDQLDDIIIYPSEFMVEGDEIDELGIVTHRREVLQGESWQRGHIVLSLADVRATLPFPQAGDNVILHEFAHQLDAGDGAMNGAPLLADQQAYSTWHAVLSKEFYNLQMDVRCRAPTVLAPYGATDPAEFFAVATEAFFQIPHKLKSSHFALYTELSKFYRQDPAARQHSAS